MGIALQSSRRRYVEHSVEILKLDLKYVMEISILRLSLRGQADPSNFYYMVV